MTVFSPIAEEVGDVIEELSLSDFPFSIYVDQCSDFRKHNGFIPKDHRFQCFLINEDPVFVGNPLADDRLWSLFMTALET